MEDKPVKSLSRRKVLKYGLLGGLTAGLAWEAGKQLFAWYVNNVATYNLIYGSVGAIIAFLLWAYLSAQILLLGAEFTAEYSRWRRAGRPLEARPLRQWLADWSKPESIAAYNAVEEDGLRLVRRERDVKS